MTYEKKDPKELQGVVIKEVAKRIAYLVQNMFNRVVSGFNKFLAAIEPAKVEAPIYEAPTIETPIAKVEPISTPVQPVQVEQPVQRVEPVQQVEKEKTEKFYVINNKRLSGSVKTDSNPRRLLISVAFLAKLVAKRAISVVKETVDTVAQTIDEKKKEGLNKLREYLTMVKDGDKMAQDGKTGVLQTITSYGINQDDYNMIKNELEGTAKVAS